MEIRTRADIYGKEAAGLLRTLSMYPGISGGQLCRFYSGKEEAVQVLLGHLKKQGRITETRSGGYFLYGQDTVLPDGGMMRAVWVLLDFIERVEFHSAGDFPVKVLFFSDGELYEVIHAAAGQEALVNHAVSQSGGGRRIVLVDDPGQIFKLDFPDISGFCTVDLSGAVEYYKKLSDGEG